MEEKNKIKSNKWRKWEMKKCIKKYNGEDAKDMIKIKLHILEVKINCKKNLDGIKWWIWMTFCSNHDETREYIMECGRESSGKQYQITEKTTEKILKIYRENKAQRYMQIGRLKKTREKRSRIQVKIGQEKYMS